MKKLGNKGFVMIETMVVITVLSLGLISLYASFAVILSKVSVRSNYENIDNIYKTYFVKDYLNSPETPACYSASISASCNDVISPGLANIMKTFNIQKIYIFKEIPTGKNYDGSTINYFKTVDKKSATSFLIVLKFEELHPNLEANTKAKITSFASLEY